QLFSGGRVSVVRFRPWALCVADFQSAASQRPGRQLFSGGRVSVVRFRPWALCVADFQSAASQRPGRQLFSGGRVSVVRFRPWALNSEKQNELCEQEAVPTFIVCPGFRERKVSLGCEANEDYPGPESLS
ncbi:MAG TPA: hypothetical protein PLP17_01935, partial [Oligoflexia bacterium]|nr:hypothetical protein [Oligoflexia bacterium]